MTTTSKFKSEAQGILRDLEAAFKCLKVAENQLTADPHTEQALFRSYDVVKHQNEKMALLFEDFRNRKPVNAHVLAGLSTEALQRELHQRERADAAYARSSRAAPPGLLYDDEELPPSDEELVELWAKTMAQGRAPNQGTRSAR
jgi:hypothetical protein